jgi:alcohol dehydrogenase
MAKAIGCTVITTVGDDAKAEKAKRSAPITSSITKNQRFDLRAQAHQQEEASICCCSSMSAAKAFNGSLLVPQARRTAGDLRLDRRADDAQPDAALPAAIQDLRLVRRFDAQYPRQPAKMAGGLLPVIDTEVALADLERGLERIESRKVFGKSSCISKAADAESAQTGRAAPRPKAKARVSVARRLGLLLLKSCG